MEQVIFRTNEDGTPRNQGDMTMSSHTAWWEDARFGMFIHWGLYAIPARGEWVRANERCRDEAYRAYAQEFDPVRYDPRAWAALARRAGMKYAVMTTKHHDGFCLFDSKLTDFQATKTPAGRDLIGEYVDAFRAVGLRVGFYHSLIDWNHPHYPVDRFHPRREDEEAKAQDRDFAKYLEYLHGQVRELLTNYGKIDLMWFDFSYGEMAGEKWRGTELVKMVRKLQPEIVLNNRLGDRDKSVKEAMKYGDFQTPEQAIPTSPCTDEDESPVLWEACMTLNDHWGYARDDHNCKSPAQVVRMLVDCVSKNGNLLLNVGPTAKGEIPGESVERLEAVGRWMDANGESIHGCGSAGLPKPDWGRFTRKGNALYAHLFEKPTGAIVLPGLAGKIRKARVLADGSEVDAGVPWTMAGNAGDAFLKLPGMKFLDDLDTVIALELT
jgi:alpha-L-fucosidase